MYSQTTINSHPISHQTQVCNRAIVWVPRCCFFINDLPSVLRNAFNGFIIGDVNLYCLLYADDLVFLSNSKEGLQRSLDTLKNYSLSWGLEVNLETF